LRLAANPFGSSHHPTRNPPPSTPPQHLISSRAPAHNPRPRGIRAHTSTDRSAFRLKPCAHRAWPSRRSSTSHTREADNHSNRPTQPTHRQSTSRLLPAGSATRGNDQATHPQQTGNRGLLSESHASPTPIEGIPPATNQSRASRTPITAFSTNTVHQPTRHLRTNTNPAGSTLASRRRENTSNNTRSQWPTATAESTPTTITPGESITLPTNPHSTGR